MLDLSNITKVAGYNLKIHQLISRNLKRFSWKKRKKNLKPQDSRAYAFKAKEKIPLFNNHIKKKKNNVCISKRRKRQ
jgi:hypothetical protein